MLERVIEVEDLVPPMRFLRGLIWRVKRHHCDWEMMPFRGDDGRA